MEDENKKQKYGSFFKKKGDERSQEQTSKIKDAEKAYKKQSLVGKMRNLIDRNKNKGK